MTTHEFELSARDLDAGGKSFRFPLRAAWMRGALEDNEANPAGPDGALEVRASKSGSDVIVHGTLKAELTVPCARCLTPVAVPIDQHVSAMYVPGTAIKGSKGMDDEYEFESGEADVIAFDGDIVVLDDLIRDELVLEIPMIPLCSEDCTGIGGGSREDQAAAAARLEESRIDPRLAPLLRLKKINEKKE